MTIAYVTSLLLASLDTNIVNVMLPTLSREFSAPLTSVKWTVIGYVLALAITGDLRGALSGRSGSELIAGVTGAAPVIPPCSRGEARVL